MGLTPNFSSNQTNHQAQTEQLWLEGALPKDRPALGADSQAAGRVQGLGRQPPAGNSQRDPGSDGLFPFRFFCWLGQLNHLKAQETFTLLRNKVFKI